MSGILDSNQRPQRPERRALPAALIPVRKYKKELRECRWKRPHRPELDDRRTVKKNCENLEQFFRFFHRYRATRSDSKLSLPNTRKKKQKMIKKAFRLTEGLARAAGLEPAISGVTGQRDNQLRYARVMFVILHESEICVNKLHHKKSKKSDFFKTDYAK